MQESRHAIVRHDHPAENAGNALPRPATGHDLSVADVMRMIRRRKFPILGFSAFILCLMAAYTYTRTPIYEAVARLRIDPNGATFELKDLDKPAPDDAADRIKTEVEVIRSNTVALRVIESLGLGGNPHFAGPDAAALKGKDLKQLQPSQRRSLLDRFGASLVVKLIPTTQIVEIRFRNSDPALATQAANSVIDQYMERNFQARLSGNAQISEWLSQQMKEIRAHTAASQQKLADFQKEHDFIGGDERSNIVIDRLKELNEQLTQSEADRIVKQGRYILASNGNPELMATATSNPTIQVLHTQAAELQEQYAQLNAKYGDGYPKLREVAAQLDSVNAEIDDQKKEIKTRLADEYGAAAKTEAMLRRAFEEQKTEAYKLDENAAQYSILKHEVEAGQQLSDALELKMKEADVASGLTSSSVMVIDRAELPDWPIEPHKKFNLALGLGGGLFGGLLLALLLDSVDDTLQTSDEFQALLELPELSSIPILGTPVDWKKTAPSPGNALGGVNSIFSFMSLPEPSCPEAEAYSSLCSLILLTQEGGPPRSLVVTSAMPGEGKSSVSLNLAISLAQRDRRVLLVDADLRCSSIQSRLGLTPGLSTMLQTGLFNHLVYRPIISLQNLFLIPAGVRPLAPTELLDSKRMRNLRELWSKQYDHVIFDTPPILAFADALTLAANADGVILVGRAEVSRRKALSKAKSVLGHAGARVLGYVLNGVKHPEYYHTPSKYYRQLNNPPSEQSASPTTG